MVYGNYINLIHMDGDTGELSETFRSIKDALSTGHICAIFITDGKNNVRMDFIYACNEEEAGYFVSVQDGVFSCEDPDAYPIYGGPR